MFSSWDFDVNILTSSPSLHSQVSDSLRAERLHSAGGRGASSVSGSSASLYGSLPRQVPPPVPPGKPLRDVGLLAGPHFGLQTLAVPPYTHNSAPVHSICPVSGRLDKDGSVRRGSFVERCQELAKGSEAAASAGFGTLSGCTSSESMRRSLAVCSELEARFGLRMPTTFSMSPGPRHSPGTPSSSHSRTTLTSSSSPTSPPHVSPSRSHAAIATHHGAPSSADSPGSAESLPGPEGPALPTSPKPQMNETSFWLVKTDSFLLALFLFSQ